VNCRDFHRILPEGTEAGRSGLHGRSFSEHRDECAACRALWERQEAMLHACRTLEVPPAPSPLAAAVRKRIAAEGVRPAARPAVARLVAAAAVLVITAGIVVAVQKGVGRPSPSGQPSASGVVAAADAVEGFRVSRGPGGVHLTWSDGEKGPYRVLRSERPDAWERASEDVVAAREWTDPSSTGGVRVTYYRVEAVRRPAQCETPLTWTAG
jgi:hypothetical protein